MIVKDEWKFQVIRFEQQRLNENTDSSTTFFCIQKGMQKLKHTFLLD